MAYRNKTYVCFDGDNDIRYYYLMKAWKQNDNTNFNFYDAHDLNTARDSSMEETIKRKLKERLDSTRIFVILLGEHTKNLTKFVRWEMQQAMKMGLPIIIVNLNQNRGRDARLYPDAILGDYLTINIPFSPDIMQYALEHWENEYLWHKAKGEKGPYSYIDEIYDSLELHRKNN